MKTFLKKIGFVVIVFMILAVCISYISLWSMRQSSFYKPSFLVNTIDDTDFDYIVLGSSIGLTTLNTKTIDSILNFRGVNLSMDDTSLSSQYLMLQHFLAQGKKTKYCILAPAAYNFATQNNKLGDNDYRFLPYITEPYVAGYFRNFSGTSANVLSNSNWLPMLGVSFFNAEIFHPSLVALLQPKKRNRFDDKGNYTYPKRNNTDQILKELDTISISFKNKNLNKIKELCSINNIELICYFSPIKGKRIVADSSLYKYINHSDLLKNTVYFYDDIHVNTQGREVVSDFFAKDFEAIIK